MGNSLHDPSKAGDDLSKIEVALREYAKIADFEVNNDYRRLPNGIFNSASLTLDFNFDINPKYAISVCVFVSYGEDASPGRCKITIGENSYGFNALNSEITKVNSTARAANGIYYPGDFPEKVTALIEDYFIWRRVNDDFAEWADRCFSKEPSLPPVSRRALTVATLVNTIESTTERLNRTYGTSNGQMIDDEVIERMSVEAETGYDIASLCQKCKEKEQGNGN